MNSTLLHIKRFILDAMGNFSVWILGPIWGYFSNLWTSGQFWFAPWVWLTIFWTGTYIIGSILAIIDKNDKWDPKKSFGAVMRLVIGLLCLGAAAGLRHTQVTGAWLPAGILDTAMVFTEFAYFTKNLGKISKLTGNHAQGEMLQMVSNAAEEYLHTKTTTTVSVMVPDAKESGPPVVTVEEKIVTVTSKRLGEAPPEADPTANKES